MPGKALVAGAFNCCAHARSIPAHQPPQLWSLAHMPHPPARTCATPTAVRPRSHHRGIGQCPPLANGEAQTPPRPTQLLPWNINAPVGHAQVAQHNDSGILCTGAYPYLHPPALPVSPTSGAQSFPKPGILPFPPYTILYTASGVATPLRSRSGANSVAPTAATHVAAWGPRGQEGTYTL